MYNEYKFMGMTPISTIDYPGELAAVLYIGGCNLSCGYCHNYAAVKDPQQHTLTWGEVSKFLDKRKGKLSAVVLCGGEPTNEEPLLLRELIFQIRKRGFKVKLDTNGTNPKLLDRLLSSNLLDYVALDVKERIDTPSRHSRIYFSSLLLSQVRRSVDIIGKSGVDAEVRVTAAAPIVTKDDVVAIARSVRGSVQRFAIQAYKFSPYQPQFYGLETIPPEELLEAARLIHDELVGCEIEVRGIAGMTRDQTIFPRDSRSQ